jgi:aconitate hydratase
MGVLPLELADGATLDPLGLDSDAVAAATFTLRGLAGAEPENLLGARLEVEAGDVTVPVVARLDTPMEAAYYEHGGILQYVLRQHLAGAGG